MKKETFKIFADYYFFYIVGDGVRTDYFPEFDNDFFQDRFDSHENFLCIGTNINMDVTVKVEVHDEKPRLVTKGYDHIVEASLKVTDEVTFMSPNFTEIDEKIELKNGNYRVRISYKNIQHLKSENEIYLIQIWEDKESENVIIKQYPFVKFEIPIFESPVGDKHGECEVKDLRKHLTMNLLLPSYIPFEDVFEKSAEYSAVSGYETTTLQISGAGGYKIFIDINNEPDNEMHDGESINLRNEINAIYTCEEDHFPFSENGKEIVRKSKIERIEFIKNELGYCVDYIHPVDEKAKDEIIKIVENLK